MEEAEVQEMRRQETLDQNRTGGQKGPLVLWGGRPMSRDTEYTLQRRLLPSQLRTISGGSLFQGNTHISGQRRASVPVCTSVPTLRKIGSHFVQDYITHT